LPGTAFLFHFNWNIFMKSYAGNWQINHNSWNRMSKKILYERIPLNGQWKNRTFRRDRKQDMDAREDLE
jgi:hypothetical protein